MFERFTKDARRAIVTSIDTAAESGAAKAGPEHLLLGLTADDQNTAARILASYGVTAAALKAAVAPGTRRAGLTDDEISALRAVGVDVNEVFRRIEEAFGREALDEPATSRPPRRRGRIGAPITTQAKKVIELSLREAIALGHREISSGHLLLALLRHGLSGSVSTVLTDHGVTYDDARRHVVSEFRKAA
jgi:ATP-dependent Clp protease ATP-binding subunit ClpA